jgi:prepilin signal peptidase PulO-like enzyme (type II secretory pathway)
MAWRFDFSPRCVVFAALASNLVYMSNYDIRYKAVSNEVLIVGAVCALCVLVWNDETAWWSLLLAGVIYFGVFAAISKITKGALGMGDAMIIGVIALYLGLLSTLFVVFYAVVLSGLLSFVLFLTKRVTKETTIPFAPFLCAGFFACIIV